MKLRQKNRAYINRAYRSIEQMFQADKTYHLVTMNIQPSKEAEIIIDHVIKGKIFVGKELKGWSLKYLNNTPVECTSLVHVKKCIKQIFDLL